MPYPKPHFRRAEVDAAGKVLAETAIADAESISARRQAKEIVDDWRASHAYPLVTLRILLQERARRVDPEALVAQRLKRLTSVETKLRRFPKMKVSRMQDLGGCRAVLPSVQAVSGLVELYRAGREEHEFVKESDYIGQPKSTGYRSLHRVYRYRSRASRKAAWDGHRIEIQIRTRLQHAWATAVETVDAITGTQLKTSGPANGDWDRFFTLMGSVLAIEEECPLVPGTPAALSELRDEVRDLVRVLDVEGSLFGLGVAIQRVPLPADAAWFLMMVDAANRRVSVQSYDARHFPAAQAEYLRLEAKHEGKPGFQACLLSTDSAKALRQAYPNYFLDVSAFAESLNLFLGPRSDRASGQPRPS